MLFSPSDLVPSYIRTIEPYIPSKPDNELKKLYGCSHIYRLNNNENPLGPPSSAKEVISSFLAEKTSIYPSGDAFYLRNKLAEKFNLTPEQFIVGNGANEVISFVIKAFCKEEDNIITADKTFAVYEWVAKFSGIEARLVPLVDFGFDDEAMAGEIDEKTKIIFICNPNNPTGTYWNENKLRRFLERIDGRQMVVVDEAYSEFVDKKDYPNGFKLIKEYPNIVVFRTFSKMYGLAGLRIGYLAGNSEVVDIIKRTCVVYSVNTIAQEAAMACLNDEEHVRLTRKMVKDGKEFLARELTLMGLTFVSGEGNFMMIKLPISDTLAYRKLMKYGIMVRTMTTFRFPDYIRITISHMEIMEKFIEALKKIIKR